MATMTAQSFPNTNRVTDRFSGKRFAPVFEHADRSGYVVDKFLNGVYHGCAGFEFYADAVAEADLWVSFAKHDKKSK